MILKVILILLAIPTGLLISWMSQDELIEGRYWFKILSFISIILSFVFFIMGENVIGLSLTFVMIVSVISLQKSYNRKWAKKRFR